MAEATISLETRAGFLQSMWFYSTYLFGMIFTHIPHALLIKQNKNV